MVKDLVTFQGEAVDFTQEERTTKDPTQKSIPSDVTVGDSTRLASVGKLVVILVSQMLPSCGADTWT